MFRFYQHQFKVILRINFYNCCFIINSSQKTSSFSKSYSHKYEMKDKKDERPHSNSLSSASMLVVKSSVEINTPVFLQKLTYIC